MIARDQVEAITGFAPGGVCPFNVPKEIPVWLDVSMKRFEYVQSKAGQEEQIDEIIDLMKSAEIFTDYQEYTRIENELNSLIAEENDNEAYSNFIKKRDEYTEVLLAFVKEKKQQEEFAYEKGQEYIRNFKQVESLVKNTTFYENDENKIKDYLESIKYNYSVENEAKLKKIASLDFKRAEEQKKRIDNRRRYYDSYSLSFANRNSSAHSWHCEKEQSKESNGGTCGT